MNAHNKLLAARGRKRRSLMRRMRRSGYTVYELADQWGISRARVYQLLKKVP